MTPEEIRGGEERRRLNFTESGLEADIAFLEAVIALVGRRPATTYQTAQVRACSTLAKALGGILAKARNRRRAGDIPPYAGSSARASVTQPPKRA
jgi:hypothetical protein